MASLKQKVLILTLSVVSLYCVTAVHPIQASEPMRKKENAKFGPTCNDLQKCMKEASRTKVLHIKSSDLTAQNVGEIKKVKDLELDVDQVDDAKMALIGQLTKLKVLYIDDSRITDKGLSNILGLTSLE